MLKNLDSPVAKNGSNKVDTADRSVHDWYRFVLAFPPHLVRTYLNKFSLGSRSTLLDPFCGTGTTLVEARLNGIASYGLEASPFLAFAASTKLDWTPNPVELLSGASTVAAQARSVLADSGIDDNLSHNGDALSAALRQLPPDTASLLIKDSISPIPLHKALTLRDAIESARGKPYYDHFRLAFANSLVTTIGNLHFGPEVGLGPIKADIPVIPAWLSQVTRIASDLGNLQKRTYPSTQVINTDAREPSSALATHSVDAVITSPPYPNEKDYTRTTRLESVLLAFTVDRAQLRLQKQSLLRSNTRNVYKNDNDERFVADNPEIQMISQEIEDRRIRLGKDSGFERLYARVTRLYFGGMTRHLSELQAVLRPGARLAYVVGDQASYLRVMIRTGHILADIATSLGYTVDGIDLFRTRFASATRSELNEEVLLLTWPG